MAGVLSPYTTSSPPPQISATIRQDGKLIDSDTAEATALPDSLTAKARMSLSPSANGESIFRPTSANSMRIRIDKPTSEMISGRSLYTHVPTGYEGESHLYWREREKRAHCEYLFQSRAQHQLV